MDDFPIVTTPDAPLDKIYFIPPRRRGESLVEWARRVVVLVDVASAAQQKEQTDEQ